jgi:hypothetical protein
MDSHLDHKPYTTNMGLMVMSKFLPKDMFTKVQKDFRQILEGDKYVHYLYRIFIVFLLTVAARLGYLMHCFVCNSQSIHFITYIKNILNSQTINCNMTSFIG